MQLAVRDSQNVWGVISRFVGIVLFPFLVSIQSSCFLNVNRKFGDDQCKFIYIARGWMEGHVPYVFAWDHKGPLTYAMYGLCDKFLGGLFWGSFMLVFLCQVASAGLIWTACRRLYGAGAALLACIFMAVVQVDILGGGGYTEDLSNPFVCWGLLCAVNLGLRRAGAWKDYVGVGLSFAAVLLLRPNNAAPYLGIFGLVVWALAREDVRQRPKSAAWVLGGIALLLVPTYVYFRLTGAWSSFISAYWDYNRLYSHRALSDRVSSLRHLLTRFAHYGGTLIFLGSLGAFLFKSKKGAQRHIELWIGVGLATTIAASALSGREYPHYALPYVPFAGIGAAYLWSNFGSAGASERHRRLGVGFYAMGALFALFLAYCGWDELKEYRAAHIPAGPDRVEAEILARTSSGDPIYLWGGEERFYLLDDRESPSRFFYDWPVLSPTYRPANIQGFVADLRRRPPKVIVDASALSYWKIGLAEPPSGGFKFESVDEQQTYGADISPLRRFVQEHYAIKFSDSGRDVYELR